MTAAASLQLRLAGEASCRRGDGAAVPLERKDALLLAYLAIEGPTSRAELAAMLWPDVDTERARANLRQRLFRMRKLVGADLLEGGAVARLRPDLQLDLGEHDASTFDELLAGVVAGDAGGLADWLGHARERRRSGRARWLAEQSSTLEAAGRLGPALAAAGQLVALDPTSEHGHRRLMRLHYLRGDRAAALASFDHCCDVLERTLGVAPDAETEALRSRVAAGAADGATHAAMPLPVSVLRPPRLVGRDAESQALAAGWSAGSATLIAGEAGLGKTRLVTDFARSHAGAVVVDARPGDARVPHALLSRLLRDVLARLPEPPGAAVLDELAPLLPELGRAAPKRGPAGSVRFLHALEALLRQAGGEGVTGIVLDDLQFADAASLEALQHVADAALGLRWIVAYRPGELNPAARAFREAFLGSDGARLHVLRPLAGVEVETLIDSLGIARLDAAALAPALARHTGGNPMYLLETLKLMLAPSGGASVALRDARDQGRGTLLPAAANVTRLIEQRIGRLSPDAVKLARCAAIADADFSAELAAHVLGARPLDLADAWAELDAAQVLRDGRFAHDLIFEAARGSVPVPLARRLHAEIAAFLEPRGAEPGRVAQHWLEAGEEAKAVPWLVAAADRAAAAWRPAEEAALLQRAAAIAGTGADAAARAVAFALLQRAHRAHLQANLGGPAHLEVLEALERMADGPLERAYASFSRADTSAQRGDGEPAEAEARAGLATIEGEHGPAADALVVDLTSALANALFVLDRPVEGAAAVRAVEPRLLKLKDRRREIEHYANLGVLLDAGSRHLEAQPAMRHVIALARSEGDRTSELMVLSNLASSYYDVGRMGAALEILREAYALKERFPELRTSALFLEIQLGNVHRALGDHGAALEWLTRSMPVLAEYVPSFVAAAHNAFARLWLELGQTARAQQQLRLAAALSPVPPWARATTHLLRARLALQDGHVGAAAQALAAAHASILPSTRFVVRAQAALLACRLEEDAAAGYAQASAVALEAGRLHANGVRIDALACAARCALALRQASVAATHVLEALALWPEHRPDGGCMGEVWAVAIACLATAGDPRAAAVQAQAATWIAATARERVPSEFRHSYLNRNRFNRELLARAKPG